MIVVVRESGYLVMVLRNKNATVSRGGKTENASIRQMRGSLVKTGTEDGQVTIESSIIKGVDANMDGGAIAGNGAWQLEKGNQSSPGGVSIGSRKILITDPHREIGHRHFTNRHHLIFSMVQFVHASFLERKRFFCSLGVLQLLMIARQFLLLQDFLLT